MDSSYNFLMSEVNCSTSITTYLVILQCGHSSHFIESCVQNRDEVSVVCCELLSSKFKILVVSKHYALLGDILKYIANM